MMNGAQVRDKGILGKKGHDLKAYKYEENLECSGKKKALLPMSGVVNQPYFMNHALSIKNGCPEYCLEDNNDAIG